jgi:hypothetical protein
MDEDDIYNPVKPNFYNYNALNRLVDDIDTTMLQKMKIVQIKINAYEIQNNNKYPYLKYLLYKNDFTESLCFPELEILPITVLNTEKIINSAKDQLFSLLELSNYPDFEEKLRFKGFFHDNNNNNNDIHIFFDLTECKLQLCDIYRSNKLWFALIDEIVNHKRLCSFFIESSVSDFFTNNTEFIFLEKVTENGKSIDGDFYELPVVGYIGVDDVNYNKINFLYTFGNAAKDKNAILGPYYYFTDYKNSIRQGGWSETGKPVIKHGITITDNEFGRFKHGGIVRFALFLGKMKIIENLLDDENDNSEIKKERINDTNLNNNMEVLTMRISDHEGKWRENYDSVFLGKIELDNGEYLKNTPIIVLKKYEQQIPLSYHYIDKSYMNDKYDENDKYIIM